MDRPSPNEVRRAAKALFLGVALGFLLLIFDRTRIVDRTRPPA